MALPVQIVMHDDEVPESRASRLAAANGFSSFKLFLSMTDMTVTGLSTGDAETIDKLAHWSGADKALLARYAMKTETHRLTWRLGDAVIGKEGRRGPRHRYCPACVVNDLDTGHGRPVSRPYVRPSWLCRTYMNCVRHRRPIVEVPHSKHAQDFTRFVASGVDLIRRQASSTDTVASVHVDDYVENRIHGVSVEPYLDRLETHVAVDLCHHLGKLLRTNGRGSLSADFDATDREEGFMVARQGEQAIRAAVGAIIEEKRPNGVSKFLFGSLGRWLRSNARRSEFAEVLELFQDTAERNLPYGVGETCFVPVRKRYLHSVKSAAAEYGIFDKRIIELLLDAELIDDATIARGRIHFDAALAHPILEAARTTLTSQEARSELDVSEGIMQQILQAKLLRRVETRSESRSYSRIRKEDLTSFQKQIFSRVSTTEVESDLMTLAAVCKGNGREAGDVLGAIIDGSLKKVTAVVGHRFRISSLRFDRADVFENFSMSSQPLCNERGGKVLKQRDAALFLRVKPSTVPYLMKLGLLDSITIANPVNNRQQHVVSLVALEEFKHVHVPVSEIAMLHDTHTNVVLAAFKALGVLPIYDDCGYAVSRFFRRSELNGVAPDIPKRRKRVRNR